MIKYFTEYKGEYMEKKYYTPAEIYNNIVLSGNKKINSSNKIILVKGIIAGMSVALAGCATTVATHDIANYGLAKLIAGVTFPVGLIIIVCAGAQLFTSECLDILNTKDYKANLAKIIKVLVLVYLANLIGAVIIGYLVANSGQLTMSSNGLAHYVFKIANGKLNLDPIQAFNSGIICNILVCLAVVTYNAAKDATGKIFGVFFVIMAFAISGVEHCVANMYYFAVAFFAKFHSPFTAGVDVSEITLSNIFTNNLLPVTLGNIVGGLFLAALLYYSIRDKELFK